MRYFITLITLLIIFSSKNANATKCKTEVFDVLPENREIIACGIKAPSSFKEIIIGIQVGKSPKEYSTQEVKEKAISLSIDLCQIETKDGFYLVHFPSNTTKKEDLSYEERLKKLRNALNNKSLDSESNIFRVKIYEDTSDIIIPEGIPTDFDNHLQSCRIQVLASPGEEKLKIQEIEKISGMELILIKIPNQYYSHKYYIKNIFSSKNEAKRFFDY